ncbi:S8 family peptidase [Alkalicoccus chagannorensis]|uniref:S8 family peptidase n=1 Tax=Alkalicoccus chagannorensis TaxID=427072 RepID=UPI00040A9C39|nr:S8 family serine peptidase [Alkalicoccus chagannorensis]
MKYILYCILLLLLSAASLPSDSHTYFLILEEGEDPDFEKEEIDLQYHLEHLDIAVVDMPASIISEVEAKDVVDTVERDEMVFLDTSVDEVSTSASTSWALNQINHQTAVDAGLTGDGVRAAVMDTGISDAHPDLRVAGGYNFFNDNNDWADDNGHGSHVAGLLAGRSPDASGVAGVAPDVDLYALKVMDERGRGTQSVMARAIDWSLEADVDILNMSVGGVSSSAMLQRAVERAEAEGMLLVAAAGNGGEEQNQTTTIDFPARYDEVIAVGAVNRLDQRAPFSSYGPQLEVAAPGVALTSADAGSSYQTKSGTSMATPFVSGMLALMQEAEPSLSSGDMRSQLRDWVQPLGQAQPNRQTGYGRIEFPAEMTVEPRPARPVRQVHAEAGAITTDYADINVEWEDRSRASAEVTYTLRRNGDTIYEGEELSHTDRVNEDGDYTYSVTVEEAASPPSEAVQSRALRIRLADPYASVLSRFSDVSEGAWYLSNMAPLVEEGIFGGFPDGTLRPSNEVTRGQVVTLFARDQGWSTSETTTRFDDVSQSNFAAGAIAEASRRGVVNGYPDGTFRPSQPVSRGELTVMFHNVYNFSSTTAPPAFSDVREDRFYYGSLIRLADAGVVQGYPDGTFRPGNPVTRAEFSAMLHRTRSR